MPGTNHLSTSLLESMVENAVRSGPSLTDLARTSGIDKEHYSNGRISPEHFLRFTLADSTARGDEHHGLSSAPAKLGLFGLMSRLAMDQRDALRVLLSAREFYDVTQDAINIQVSKRRGEIVFGIESDVASKGAAAAIEELYLIAFHMYLCWFADTDISPNEISVGRQRAGDEGALHPLTQCPVKYGRGESFLTFPEGELNVARARSTDVNLVPDMVRRHLDRVERFSRAVGPIRRPSPLVSRIEALFGEGVTQADEIARYLAMSEATLRRKLRAAGVSLRNIRQDRLCAEATRLLIVERCATEEVADALGFSEPSSFRRAFKAWTGVSPAVFLKGAESGR